MYPGNSAPDSTIFDELVVIAPAWTVPHIADLLARLGSAGLVFHWEWAAEIGADDGEACTALRVLADVPGLRAGAAGSGSSEVGLLCFWLLSLADGEGGAPPTQRQCERGCGCVDGWGDAWGCRAETAELGVCSGTAATDFGFLLCADR
jgi:hypothetical protein